MKLTPEQVVGLKNALALTNEQELNCNECLELVGEYAELDVEDSPIPVSLLLVKYHLDLCVECQEEYEALLKALNSLE